MGAQEQDINYVETLLGAARRRIKELEYDKEQLERSNSHCRMDQVEARNRMNAMIKAAKQGCHTCRTIDTQEALNRVINAGSMVVRK